MVSRCCNAEIVTDYTSGDIICTECGLVEEEKLMMYQYHDGEEIHDINENFNKACTNLLLSVNAPMGWLSECVDLYNRLSWTSCERLNVIAIICVVSKQPDMYLQHHFQMYAKSKKMLKTISRIFQDTTTTKEQVYFRVAHSVGLTFAQITEAHVVFKRAIRDINQTPTAIACAVLVNEYAIDIDNISTYNGLNVQTVRKALGKLKILLKDCV